MVHYTWRGALSTMDCYTHCMGTSFNVFFNVAQAGTISDYGYSFQRLYDGRWGRTACLSTIRSIPRRPDGGEDGQQEEDNDDLTDATGATIVNGRWEILWRSQG